MERPSPKPPSEFYRMDSTLERDDDVDIEAIGGIIPRVMKRLILTSNAPPRRTLKRISKQPYAGTEWHEQRTVFEWAKLMENREPRLKLLNDSMNGLQVNNPGVIMRANLCGMKSGYLDIDLPVWGRQDHTPGLHIEMKQKHKDWISCFWECASEDQRWWRDILRAQGRRVEVAHGAAEAIAIIKKYLGIE